MMEIRKWLELNGIETIYSNMWNGAKVIFRGKFQIWKAYLQKKKKMAKGKWVTRKMNKRINPNNVKGRK